MVDAVGTTKYAYALGGQLWTEDGPWSSDTVTNSYDNRLRVELSLAQPTGRWANEFDYDAAKRLTTVVSPAGTFTYTLAATAPASVLAKKLQLPNTSYITNAYDNVARLHSTSLKNSSHTILNSHNYQLNVGHQRTQQSFNAGSTVDYTYDKIGQLQVADSGTASEDRGYAYDSAWNLKWRTNNAALEGFTVDGLNQQVTSPGSFYQYYDGNGNLSLDALYQYFEYYGYEYDDENRLTAIYHVDYEWEVPLWRSYFKYDGLGRLREREDWTFNWNSEYVEDRSDTSLAWERDSITYYLYDGMRVIQERDGNNLPTVSYTRGTDLSGTLEGAGGIGGLLGRSHGYSSGNWSTHNFYHADGNGNITYLVNSSQTEAASYRYDPYGNTISSSGSLASANVYRFSSKEHHAYSGFYYYGYRWYMPYSQRWLNRDPIGEIGGKNLYGFIGNAPINRLDLNGYEWLPTGKFPRDNDSHVVCKNNKPVPYVVFYTPEEVAELLPSRAESKGYYCAQKCSYEHEESHIKDILAQNPNICVNAKNGTTIGNTDPNNELLNSEQKAHQVEADCLAKCAVKCPSNVITKRQKQNDDWIKEHQYE